MKLFYYFVKQFIGWLKNIRPNNMLCFLFLMIFLAYMTPQVGSYHIMGYISSIGFFITFFFYGVSMSPSIFWNGISNWRLHLLVISSTFLIFPIVVLILRHFFETEFTNEIWLGIFYISVLPSTISSSVVMVSIAGGNIPAAIFNASISGVIGVFITPIWMGIFIANMIGEDKFSVFSSICDLLIIIVLPLCLGMYFNKRWGELLAKNRKFLRLFDQSVILLLVYTAFSKSFMSNAFDGFVISQLLVLCVGIIILFFCVYMITLIFCKIMGFNVADTITALFCGSKKSLAHGIAMSKIIFAELPSVGIILLPIMLYHAIQLLIVSIIAKRFADKSQNVNNQ
ncbi:MAG: bile acid:sodium symporter [Planctomycetaceae bacterium]|jgi:sodium/bile acid cotransporter 7|nr:bile acid:sodium symporter [Planctomycetaceae bacterium]